MFRKKSINFKWGNTTINNGLCGLPYVFSRIKRFLLLKNQTVSCIDGIITQAKTPDKNFDKVFTYHNLLTKSGLKAQRKKLKFSVRMVYSAYI